MCAECEVQLNYTPVNLFMKNYCIVQLSCKPTSFYSISQYYYAYVFYEILPGYGDFFPSSWDDKKYIEMKSGREPRISNNYLVRKFPGLSLPNNEIIYPFGWHPYLNKSHNLSIEINSNLRKFAVFFIRSLFKFKLAKFDKFFLEFSFMLKQLMQPQNCK